MEVNYTQLLDRCKYYQDAISVLQSIYLKGRGDFIMVSNSLRKFKDWDGNFRFKAIEEIQIYFNSMHESSHIFLTELLGKYSWLQNHSIYWFRDYSIEDDKEPVFKIDETIESDYLVYFLRDIEFIIIHLKELLKPKEYKKDSVSYDWLEAFFDPGNDILPPDDHLKYKNLLSSKTKKIIDIQKEPWKVFAVLMVWAENEKLDLSEFNKERKSKELNVKVSHYMAKYFTVEGKNRDNSYYNSDVFHSLISLINEKFGDKHRKFMKRLDTICGKLEFDLPEKLKYLP